MCIKFSRFLRSFWSFFSWAGNCYTDFFRSSSSTSFSLHYRVPFYPFRVWLGKSTYLRIPARTGKFLSDNGFLHCQVVTHSNDVWFYFYREKLRDCVSINIYSGITANKTYHQYRINSVSFISTLQNAFGVSLTRGQLLKIAEVRYNKDCIKMRIITY